MRIGLFLIAVLVTGGAGAAFADAEGLHVTRVVLSAATTDTRPTAIFFDVANDGPNDDAITSVETPMCGRAELHDHIVDDDVLKMRMVSTIPVAAGATVSLKPMGLHVMCFNPVLPHQVGASFPLTVLWASGVRVDRTGEIITFEQALRRADHH